MIIILNNENDLISYAFTEMYRSRVNEVIDWYSENGQSRWTELGGPMSVSAFPSVALKADGAESWDIYRMPTQTEMEKLITDGVLTEETSVGVSRLDRIEANIDYTLMLLGEE